MLNINRMPSQQEEENEQPPSIAALRKETLGAEREFAEDPHQEETAAIDRKIEALQKQKQEGRKFIARMTNKEMIDIAEKNEDAIDADIAELELQKRTLLGQKPS